MKTLTIIALMLTLTACSSIQKLTNTNSTDPVKSPEEKMEAWIGQPLIKLEKNYSFGIPMHTSTLSDGSIAYVYEFEGNIRAHYSVYGHFGNSNVSQAKCSFTFYSKDNRITQLNWRGQCRLDSSRLPET